MDYPETPECGASAEEIDAWLCAVRTRNENMEVQRAIFDDERTAQNEAFAEAAYKTVKDILEHLPSGASHWFWLKWLWYAKWRASNAAKTEIELVEKEFAKRDLGNGNQIAHIPRPLWIRPPDGGDEFDRGEVQERLKVPF